MPELHCGWGIGQVNVAKEVKSALGLNVTIAGLYKNEKHQTKGLLDEEGKILDIDPRSQLFFLFDAHARRSSSFRDHFAP